MSGSQVGSVSYYVNVMQYFQLNKSFEDQSQPQRGRQADMFENLTSTQEKSQHHNFTYFYMPYYQHA